MAVNAATAYEFRATNGANTNGGGFYDADPGTSVDYSQQNSAQESYTTLATSGAGVTTVTCGGGDTFAAGIAGNMIYITGGTNFDTGWYQVTTRNSSTSVVFDRSPTSGGAGSTGTGNMGGALALLTDAFLDDTNLVLAGVKLWIKNDGTMTLTGSIDITTAGTTVAVIAMEGYNTSRGDNPIGTNRPLIACGANTFKFGGDNWIFKHLRITTTEANGFEHVSTDIHILYNIAVNNSSGTGSRYGLYCSGRFNVVGCDLQAANGYAIYAGSISTHVGNYIHDSSVAGIRLLGEDQIFVNNVIDSCGIGVDISIRDNLVFINNTFYNNTTAISGTTGYAAVILNNIFDANTTGVSWSSAFTNHYIDYNCWDNTTDVSNVTKGDNSVTGDPGMTDPANGDFSITSSSNCVDAALDAGDLTGATV